MGFSMGATHGALLTSLERRIKLAVLLDGGFWPGPRPSEVDDINFAPRVKVPVLMINGRLDRLANNPPNPIKASHARVPIRAHRESGGAP